MVSNHSGELSDATGFGSYMLKAEIALVMTGLVAGGLFSSCRMNDRGVSIM